jgi:subtilisin family serine protease
MEGPITSNPDTRAPYIVTIPFFGVPGTVAVTTTLVAADGGTVTLTPVQLTNIGYQYLASFTSGGPRNGDSIVKPDVTAPGIAVQSAGVGTGFRAATISGTSQASPFTAGTAALVVQAHPSWSPERIKAAIVNTADPTLDLDYTVRLAGSGVVQAQRAVDTRGLILAGPGQSSLSYGAEQIRRAYSETIPMRVVNTSGDAISYTIASNFVGSSLGAAISASPSDVTVAANSSRVVNVTLSLTEAAVAALPPAEASNFGALVTIAGAVVATPTRSSSRRAASPTSAPPRRRPRRSRATRCRRHSSR